MKTRFGRTVGAGVGALLFVLFLSSLADRLGPPVIAAERSDITITVVGR